jgi:hypothetical protein
MLNDYFTLLADIYTKYKKNKYTIEQLENEILTDIMTLSSNQYFEPSMIWESIIANQYLSEEFMDKYYNNLNLTIYEYQQLSENFIQLHGPIINFN